MNLKIKHLGIRDYSKTLTQMKNWVDAQDKKGQQNNQNQDEIWMLQHCSVYTKGQSESSTLDSSINTEANRTLPTSYIRGIPIIQSDRGGKTTYHGPGQLIAYMMINLNRKGWGPQKLVQLTESIVLAFLQENGILGQLKEGAPGVYVMNKKIASLGFRIRKGISYHGLSINVDMDMRPFNNITPCGQSGIQMTQMKDETHDPIELNRLECQLKEHFMAVLS